MTMSLLKDAKKERRHLKRDDKHLGRDAKKTVKNWIHKNKVKVVVGFITGMSLLSGYVQGGEVDRAMGNLNDMKPKIEETSSVPKEAGKEIDKVLSGVDKTIKEKMDKHQHLEVLGLIKSYTRFLERFDDDDAREMIDDLADYKHEIMNDFAVKIYEKRGRTRGVYKHHGELVTVSVQHNNGDYQRLEYDAFADGTRLLLNLVRSKGNVLKTPTGSYKRMAVGVEGQELAGYTVVGSNLVLVVTVVEGDSISLHEQGKKKVSKDIKVKDLLDEVPDAL